MNLVSKTRKLYLKQYFKRRIQKANEKVAKIQGLPTVCCSECFKNGRKNTKNILAHNIKNRHLVSFQHLIEVENNPQEFILLCYHCHSIIHNYIPNRPTTCPNCRARGTILGHGKNPRILFQKRWKCWLCKKGFVRPKKGMKGFKGSRDPSVRIKICPKCGTKGTLTKVGHGSYKCNNCGRRTLHYLVP